MIVYYDLHWNFVLMLIIKIIFSYLYDRPSNIQNTIVRNLSLSSFDSSYQLLVFLFEELDFLRKAINFEHWIMIMLPEFWELP